MVKNRMYRCKTPVVVFAYNRPDLLSIVLSSVQQVAPPEVFIFCDGPKSVASEKQQAVKEVVALCDRFASRCENVRVIQRTSNLGSRTNVQKGLDQVFEIHDRAIVLEDDCVTNADFFRFCDEMLQAHESDKTVGIIGGTRPIDPQGDGSGHAIRSQYPIMSGGWATWARVWKQYDHELELWPEAKRSGFLTSMFPGNPLAVKHWSDAFDMVCARRIDAWDYQVTLTLWMLHMDAIIPPRNLTSNIGFRSDGTHTLEFGRYAFLDLFDLQTWPVNVKSVSKAYDRKIEQEMYSTPVVRKVFRKLHELVTGEVRSRELRYKEWMSKTIGFLILKIITIDPHQMPL